MKPCRLVLERTEVRCSGCIVAQATPEEKRPYLVKVWLNDPAQDALVRRTGSAQPSVTCCFNLVCGAAMDAVKHLAPIQSILT